MNFLEINHHNYSQLIGNENLNEIYYYKLKSLEVPQKEKGKYEEILAKVLKLLFFFKFFFNFSILNLQDLLFFTKKIL